MTAAHAPTPNSSDSSNPFGWESLTPTSRSTMRSPKQSRSRLASGSRPGPPRSADAGSGKRLPFLEPVHDLAAQLAAVAADEDADMSAGHDVLRIVLAADLLAENDARRRRNDVVGLGIEVEDRHGDVLEVDATPADLELAVDHLVALVEVLQPLPG